MKTSDAKREYWRSDLATPFAQSYGGVLDLANGFDRAARFESDLKYQALLFEKIIVPDGFFYMPGPIYENVRLLRKSGQREDENVVLQFLRNGVLVPSLRKGDSLLDNWQVGGMGIKPGVLGYPTLEQGRAVLEVIEPHIAFYTRWPKAMAKTKKPPYAAEVERLFVGGKGVPPLLGREEITFLLKLKGQPHKGWHGLLERFQNSIAAQIASGEFRRAGLEQAVVDHFKLPRFNEVYETVNQLAEAKDHDQWADAVVARRLLEIASTVYEAYQARQFNCVGNLFPQSFRPVVNADLYSRVVELNAGRPYSGGEIVPCCCIDPRRISITKILKFRESPLFQDQYCAMLRKLKAGEPGQSFVDINADFYRFMEKTYLPAIIQEFEPAIDGERLKRLGGLVQAGSLITAGLAAAAAGGSAAGSSSVPTLFTETSVLGMTMLATVAIAGAGATVGTALEKGAQGISDVTTNARNYWLKLRATHHLNGFVATENEAAAKQRQSVARGGVGNKATTT